MSSIFLQSPGLPLGSFIFPALIIFATIIFLFSTLSKLRKAGKQFVNAGKEIENKNVTYAGENIFKAITYFIYFLIISILISVVVVLFVLSDNINFKEAYNIGTVEDVKEEVWEVVDFVEETAFEEIVAV